MSTTIKSSAQEKVLPQNTLQDLRSPSLFAKSPILGLSMFLAGSLLFGILAYSLRTSDALLQWDMTIAKTFREAQINASWSVMEDILFGIFVGKEVVILTGTTLAIYFFYKHFWLELATIIIGLGGGGLIWVILSRYFARPRPTDHLDVLQVSGPSFPSGPALMSLLC